MAATKTKPTSSNNTPAKSDTALPAMPQNVSNVVLKQVQTLMSNRTLILPNDYSVENALRSAWFAIQNSEQRDKILACTKESQSNALYDMVLQALDASKKQCYFIPYGTRLVCQRSYFGDVAVAQRVKPGITAYFDVIYKGEPVELLKIINLHGYVTTIKHSKKFPRESSEIVGAYCGFIDEHGNDMGIELMDMAQIKQSWKKSKTYGAASQTFHNEQPDQACLRTVIRRRCKPIINQSNDSALLAAVRRQEIDSAEAEVEEQMAIETNQTSIAIGASSETDETPSETTAPSEQAPLIDPAEADESQL